MVGDQLKFPTIKVLMEFLDPLYDSQGYFINLRIVYFYAGANVREALH